MAKINVLDKHTAELIAAGEVVERPSSVIKEMVENAIDAGATSVTVEIQNGGITYIRITDNGSGIARDDVPKAFLRHATSKIQRQEDLDAIATLGFRGEALASIAAVTKLELLTKTKEETFGTHYIIEGGEEVSIDDAGCPNGSTFIIRDLFYNTPARMKFLKKNVAEGNAVADVLDRMALSHPEVAFKLIRDGKQVLLTSGDGKLFSAIHGVFGNEFASTLLPVSYQMGNITLNGYTCKPVYARKNRSMQLFFINGRFVKTGTGAAALQEAYKNSIMVGKFPSGVFHLQFPFDQIDVNVHPAKIEVRFSDERAIFNVIYYGVKSALEKGDTRPQMKLESKDPVPMPLPASTTLKKASASFVKPVPHDNKGITTPTQTKFRMFSPEKPVSFSNAVVLEDSGKENIPLSFDKQPIEATKPLKEPESLTDKKPSFVPSVSGTSLDIAVEPTESVVTSPDISITEKEEIHLRFVGEVFKTYILVEVDDRILVIDKHAAHERILFDKLKASASNNKATQMLLTPVTLTLRKQEYSLLIDNADLLEKAGILLESFGDTVVRVLGVPMNLEQEDIPSLLDEIVAKLSQGIASVEADRLDWLFHSIACKSAVKGGKNTSEAELKALAHRIVVDDSVRYCPHGRPVAMWLTKGQLEKQFGRSGG
jgi:DNA mismatch repair protein MutL